MNETQTLLLKIIGSALFGGTVPSVEADEIVPLIRESEAQTVFPLLFSTIYGQVKEALPAEEYKKYRKALLIRSTSRTRNFAEHGALHKLMTASGIPYVVVKGLASAGYYPDPTLRNMGDVDFLVPPEDLQRAGKVLEGEGFAIDHGEENDGIHIVYRRPPKSIWEIHQALNGIPGGKIGERIQEEMNGVIPTSSLTEIGGIVCRVPDRLHHGLILLLHTASHLTSEGVGLRHLCDWVVFASSLDDAAFREIFEEKLKSYGLWLFAQVLTLLGIRYLNAPKRPWAWEAVEKREVDEEMLLGLMDDILSGGNFGTKDLNRYREIKYIASDGDRTVGNGGIIRQGFRAMNAKACKDYRIIRRHRVLLPIGWIAEGGKYIGLLLSGKRKTGNTKRMLQEAADRKKMYSRIKLFEA